MDAKRPADPREAEHPPVTSKLPTPVTSKLPTTPEGKP
jgi:hypothetical protein